MPYTDDQIRAYARQLGDKGASEDEIDRFVTAAKTERGTAQAAPSAEPPMAQRVMRGLTSALTGQNANPPSYTKRLPGDPARLSSSTMGLFLEPNQLATAARAVPVGMAMANPATSPAAMAWPALAAFGTELAAKGIEGSKAPMRSQVADAMKAMALFGTPVPAVSPARGLLRPAAQALKFGAAAAITEGGAETIRRTIDQGEMSGYDSLASAFKETSLPALFGFVMGGMGSKLGATGEQRARDDARKMFLDKIGIEDPTLAMVRPKFAGHEELVAADSGKLMNQIGRANMGTVKAAYEAIGEAPANKVIAERLSALAPAVDKANDLYGASQKAADDALMAYKDAQQKAAQLPPGEVDALYKDVQAKLLNKVQTKAALAYQLNRQFGDAIPNSVKAAELGGVIRDLVDVRSAIGDDLYKTFFQTASEASGRPINRGTPLFSKEAMLAKAEDALGHDAKTTMGETILNGIKNATAEKIVTGLDPKTGKPIESEIFSKAQLDGLRQDMRSGFKQAAGAMDAEDRAVSSVYMALTEEGDKQMAALFGEQAAGVLKEAKDFWSTTSQLRDTALGRAFLKKASGGGAEGGDAVQNLADETIQRVANGIVSGNVDELNMFKKFVAAIGNHNKSLDVKTPRGTVTLNPKTVADYAMQTMAGAMHNALKVKHTKGGTLDFDGLLGDVLNAAAIGKEHLPFPVENLGYGSIQTLRNWRSANRQFSPKDITPEVIDSVFQNPEARRVIENGGIDGGKVLKGAMAEAIFAKKVQEQVALQEAGLLAPAKQKSHEAGLFATDKKVEEAAALSAYEKARANPILDAFRGKGGYEFITTEGHTGKGTITHFLLNEVSGDTAQKLMGALREKNPDLANLVEQRVLTDHLNRFVKPDPYFVTKDGTQGQRLDTQAIREFFRPMDAPNSAVAGLKARIGEPAVKKMENLLLKVAEVDASMAQGRMPSPREGQAMLTIMGIAAVPSTLGGANKVGLPRQVINFVMDAVKKRHYNTMSALVLDKAFASAVLRNAGSMAEAITSLPLQKSYLLMANQPLMEELGLIDAGEQNGKVPRFGLPQTKPSLSIAPITKGREFETALSPHEEQDFRKWKLSFAPSDSGDDYDLRGAFKAGLSPDSNGHWPDTYKKPNHPTFSDQSIYYKAAPDKAGRWEGDTYIRPVR